MPGAILAVGSGRRRVSPRRPEQAWWRFRVAATCLAFVADMAANSETVPEPFATRSYSGKFNLRVGQDLHRKLAMEAAERQVSLNQHVVTKLSAAS